MLKTYYLNKFFKDNFDYFGNLEDSKQKGYDYYNVLCDMPECSRILRHILKTSQTKREKMIGIIKNYKRYELTSEQLNLILSQVIDLTKTSIPSMKIPHLEVLYYACNNNENLYKLLVSDLKTQYTIPDSINYDVLAYINVLMNNNKVMHNQLMLFSNSVVLRNDFILITPRKLDILLKYNDTSKMISDFKIKFISSLSNLGEEKRKTINELSDSGFKNVLRCIFSTDYYQTISYRLQAIGYLLEKNDDILVKDLDMISVIPEYLINYAGNIHTASFLDFISSSIITRGDLQSLQKVPTENEKTIRHMFFTEDTFYELDPSIQKLLIKKLGNKPCNNSVEYCFDLYKDLNINEEKLQYKIFKYILDDNDEELLKVRKQSIESIKTEICNGDITTDMCDFYFKLLNAGLKEKSVEEKCKLIKARSNYFESHSFIDFYTAIQNNSNIEIILELLKSSDNDKIMNYYYQFAMLSNNYSNKVVDKIIKKLEDSQSVSSAKSIIETIGHPNFVAKTKNEQEKELKLLPIQVEKLKSKELEVIIKDSIYVENLLQDNNSLEFKNSDTGLKIIVKKAKSGKKN